MGNTTCLPWLGMARIGLREDRTSDIEGLSLRIPRRKRRFHEKSYYSLGNKRQLSDFCRFFGLSWETSTLKNYHPEDSKHYLQNFLRKDPGGLGNPGGPREPQETVRNGAKQFVELIQSRC